MPKKKDAHTKAKSFAEPNGKAPTSEEKITQENIKTVAKIEERANANRTTSEVIAGAIADFCGSMTFVWVHVIWFGAWILANTLSSWEFDPFPFTFLTLVVSLEAIFLSTFILINQNRETAITDRRAHLDLQINLLSEQENTKMLFFLEKIAEKIGVEIDDDLCEDLTEETDPEKIMKQLDKEQGPVGR